MGADKHEKKRRKDSLPLFVPLFLETLNSPAWRTLSHGAKALFIALKRRYNRNNHNNGRIFLSQRNAAKELQSHHDQIVRWFRELEHYGFIVKVSPGYLGIEGMGQAPRWRITELGYMHDLPTKDFLRWDGTPFVNKPKPRTGKPARGVQENPHSTVQENRQGECPARAGNPAQRKSNTACRKTATNLD
jgi:hypothetical protein